MRGQRENSLANCFEKARLPCWDRHCISSWDVWKLTRRRKCCSGWQHDRGRGQARESIADDDDVVDGVVVVGIDYVVGRCC